MKYPVLLCKYGFVSIHTSVLHNYSRCSTHHLKDILWAKIKKYIQTHTHLNMYVYKQIHIHIKIKLLK